MNDKNLKKLKFLVDVGVGRKVETWLLNEGYDVKSVRNINPRMTDREVLELATAENRMIITMDKDFGELVYNSGLFHTGILLLRLEGANSNEKVEIIEKILRRYSDEILNKFCVFKDGKLRVRG